MREKESILESIRQYCRLRRQWLRLYTVEPDGTKTEWIQ